MHIVVKSIPLHCTAIATPNLKPATVLCSILLQKSNPFLYFVSLPLLSIFTLSDSLKKKIPTSFRGGESEKVERREKMGEKDDGFGLCLSLGSSSFPDTQKPLHFPLNLMQSSPMSLLNLNQKAPFNPAFQSSSDLNVDRRLNMRGIDVNLPATMADGEEEILVSSPNSTVSSVSGKRSEREENEAERDSSYEEDGGDAAARKKLRLSKEQSAMLEETFKEHSTLNPKQKLALAKELNLRPRQVEVWFQNRRARTKLKQTEVDCEYLKRCCENLTEENKRLQKEVSELRTLKLSPQFYMNMSPPTTLTMCPQCERVAVSSTSSITSASASSSLPTTGVANTRHHNNPVGAQSHQPTPVNPSWATLFPPEKPEGHRPRS